MRSFAMPGLSHHTESVESLNKALGLEGHAVVRIAGTVRSGMLSGYCPRFESLAMAIHFFGPDDERGTNGNIHFGRVGRRSPLQLSRRKFRLVTCYDCGIIAIETFIRPFAQVRARRSFSDKHHRCAAIRARMNVKSVGREAKERVRRGHIALLRPISTVKSMQIAIGWWFTLNQPAQSISERNIGPTRKGGPSDRLCCG
jgi:hypothetical protein